MPYKIGINMAGKHGGARKGGGKPKGALTKRTQELVAQATQGGATPIEILLNEMRWFYNLSKTAEAQLDTLSPLNNPEEFEKAFKAALALKNHARTYAVDAAPYVHPRLAAMQANVVVSNAENALAELE